MAVGVLLTITVFSLTDKRVDTCDHHDLCHSKLKKTLSLVLQVTKMTANGGTRRRGCISMIFVQVHRPPGRLACVSGDETPKQCSSSLCC